MPEAGVVSCSAVGFVAYSEAMTIAVQKLAEQVKSLPLELAWAEFLLSRSSMI